MASTHSIGSCALRASVMPSCIAICRVSSSTCLWAVSSISFKHRLSLSSIRNCGTSAFDASLDTAYTNCRTCHSAARHSRFFPTPMYQTTNSSIEYRRLSIRERIFDVRCFSIRYQVFVSVSKFDEQMAVHKFRLHQGQSQAAQPKPQLARKPYGLGATFECIR